MSADIKLKYKKTVVQTQERTVPDYYSVDDSPLGRAVDFLLEDFTHRGRAVRDRLWDDDAESVEQAISQLDRAYDTARGVARALGVGNQISGKVHNQK
jgi:hypothetical protein